MNNSATAAESTLSAILGREAALKETVITWAELLRSEERYEVKLKLRY